jgi:hypothetical protein
MNDITEIQDYSRLVTEISSLVEQGRKTAVSYVNTALVATYWLIGKRIVEYEQKGEERAKYGEALLENISTDLSRRFGKGWGIANLRAIRQFYVIYKDFEKRYTVCSEIAEYALGGMNNRIFASKYKLQLPDPEVIRLEIENERNRLLEMKIVE